MVTAKSSTTHLKALLAPYPVLWQFSFFLLQLTDSMKISACSDLTFVALVAMGEEGKWAWKMCFELTLKFKGTGEKAHKNPTKSFKKDHQGFFYDVGSILWACLWSPVLQHCCLLARMYPMPSGRTTKEFSHAIICLKLSKLKHIMACTSIFLLPNVYTTQH